MPAFESKQQAIEYLQNLYDTIFADDADASLLPRYFSKDLVGYRNGDGFDWEMHVWRYNYFRERYSNHRIIIKDVVLLENDCLYMIAYIRSFDKSTKEPGMGILACAYEFKNNLITKQWLLSRQDRPQNIDNQKKFELDKDIRSYHLIRSKSMKTWEELSRERFFDWVEAYNKSHFKKSFLSDGEILVLFYFLNGYTAKKIAQVIGVNHRTIEGTIMSIRRKYGNKSRHELRDMFSRYKTKDR
jgi:DNA-binding CsgD family transcriptional regulator